MLSLARGSFWYKCPFVPLIVRNFSPHPPSPSSHTHFTPFTRTHTIPSYHEQVSYERRNHLRLFRLGLTRVLSFDFVVWMGHLNTIPNCHSGTYSTWGLTISLKIKNFSSWDSWKESVTVRRLQHLLTEATSQKSNLYPSQGEKECAACLLMIKLHIKDTCSDCFPRKCHPKRSVDTCVDSHAQMNQRTLGRRETFPPPKRGGFLTRRCQLLRRNLWRGSICWGLETWTNLTPCEN